MRKLNCYTLIVVILATMLLSMSGCYIVDGGRMQDVIGTYQLTVCNTQENDSEGLIDLLTLNGIECYLVVGDEGYGFIVYADNETTLLCRQVKLTYGFSSEDDTLIEYVSYVDAECEYEEKLAYNGKSKQLNKTQLAITIGTISTNYGQTTYSKVSEATDLSYVEEQLGELDYTPYELVASFRHGSTFAYFRYSEDDVDCAGYSYYIVDIDIETLTAAIYYADDTLQSGSSIGLAVSYELDEDSGLINQLNIGDYTFQLEPYGLMRAYDTLDQLILVLEVGDYDAVAIYSPTTAVGDVIDTYLTMREGT